MSYTFEQFKKDFPDEDTCLEYIFKERYGESFTCPKCNKRGFHRVKNRRCYACAWCGHQIYPTSGTMFHKSPTKLTDWFFAIFLMENSKNISPAELSKRIGIAYRTAQRMIEKITREKKLKTKRPLLTAVFLYQQLQTTTPQCVLMLCKIPRPMKPVIRADPP